MDLCQTLLVSVHHIFIAVLEMFVNLCQGFVIVVIQLAENFEARR